MDRTVCLHYLLQRVVLNSHGTVRKHTVFLLSCNSILCSSE